MIKKRFYTISLIYVIFFLCLLNISKAKKDNDSSIKTSQSFTCDICSYSVMLCEKNYNESYTLINYQMLQYCHNLGRYSSNCKEITQKYLLKIYSAVHNPSINNEQICLLNNLCSDDNNFNHNDNY
uniref:Saposin B-type domain-containing protein n=1 Tax=Strongyloides stercoralis TaxID=6248 RepID=A0A0K0ESE1_STRER